MGEWGEGGGLVGAAKGTGAVEVGLRSRGRAWVGLGLG